MPPLPILDTSDSFFDNEFAVAMLVCMVSLVYALTMAFVYIKKSKFTYLINVNMLWLGDPKSKHGFFSFPKMTAGQPDKPINLDYSSQNEEDMPLLADSGS